MTTALLRQSDGPASDYETQGMALKLKELDEELKKYETKTYGCEAHLTWCDVVRDSLCTVVCRCCGGSLDFDDDPERAAKYPSVGAVDAADSCVDRFTIAQEARRLGACHFDPTTGACEHAATHRVIILECAEGP